MSILALRNGDRRLVPASLSLLLQRMNREKKRSAIERTPFVTGKRRFVRWVLSIFNLSIFTELQRSLRSAFTRVAFVMLSFAIRHLELRKVHFVISVKDCRAIKMAFVVGTSLRPKVHSASFAPQWISRRRCTSSMKRRRVK